MQSLSFPSRLRSLEITGAGVTGSVPASMSDLTGLLHCDLSGNAITDFSVNTAAMSFLLYVRGLYVLLD